MAMSYMKMFFDYLDAMEPLGDAERGRLLTALLEYGRTGEAPQLSGNERFIFPMIRAQMDRDTAAYESEMAAFTEAKREAGRKGGLASASRRKQSQAKPSKAEQSQANQAKDKDEDKDEDKDKDKDKDEDKSSAPVQWAENVTMTNAEHQKLLDAYGEADTERLILILDNYKGSSGKRYKSDYRAILSWCVDRLAEEKCKEKCKEKPSAKAPLVQTSAGDAEAAMVRRLNA